MDEQTITQQSNYDVSADGVVNPEYEEEPSKSEAEKELAPDGVRLRNDGELEFGTEFFGDVKDSPEEPTTPATEAPKWYTDEELSQIPFQQWDLSRLNGDTPVSKIAPIVQAQLQQARAQMQTQAWDNLPLPEGITEPKAYTPKELSQEALKLACEKLGIKDADEFDSYELEHKAAYELAAQELIQKRNVEISGYQTTLQTWRDNAKYQNELMHRADFKEFDQWYLSECQRAGYTPQQVDAALYEAVKQNGNNFGVIKQVIEGWYQTFQRQKAAQKPKVRIQPNTGLSPSGIRRIPRNPSPAVLESTRGNNYAGRPSIRAEAFADMSSDEQANALIKLGYV